jgi:hypothetical protein
VVRFTKGPKKVTVIVGSAELLALIAILATLVKNLIG